MAKTVRIVMQDGEDHTYADVGRIDEDPYQYKLYDRTGGILAVVAKGDVTSLHTSET